MSSDINESLLISLIEIKLELENGIFISSEIFIIFHFEISGIVKSELHPLKILFILILYFEILDCFLMNKNEKYIIHIYKI